MGLTGATLLDGLVCISLFRELSYLGVTAAVFASPPPTVLSVCAEDWGGASGHFLQGRKQGTVTHICPPTHTAEPVLEQGPPLLLPGQPLPTLGILLTTQLRPSPLLPWAGLRHPILRSFLLPC